MEYSHKCEYSTARSNQNLDQRLRVELISLIKVNSEDFTDLDLVTTRVTTFARLNDRPLEISEASCEIHL